MMRAVLDSAATKVVALVVALAAVGVISYELFVPAATRTAVAYFPVANHLYPGSDVDVLGVKIGTVESVTPQGAQVKVVLRYDAARRLPADVSAVVGEPTLVADRVVELTPVYDGTGPVLADGATIPLQRTGVPLELDQLSANLVDLAKALGPQGANRSGSLTRVLQVAAANLRGQGPAANRAVRGVSALVGTLGDNREALFSTVRHLRSFVDTLAAHDRQTRSFTVDLADVSHQLAAESRSFSAAIHELAVALGEVNSFVRTHRKALADDVAGLAKVSNVLARERVLLAHIVDMGAVGISNYPHMYTPSARTYNARFANVYTDNPALWLCQIYGSVGGDPKQCLKNLKPLSTLPLPKSAGKR